MPPEINFIFKQEVLKLHKLEIHTISSGMHLEAILSIIGNRYIGRLNTSLGTILPRRLGLYFSPAGDVMVPSYLYQGNEHHELSNFQNSELLRASPFSSLLPVGPIL